MCKALMPRCPQAVEKQHMGLDRNQKRYAGRPNGGCQSGASGDQHQPKQQPTLMEAERQALLLDKLDLSGLEAWPVAEVEKARCLLQEYHDIFS